jgi:hypothetical protein
LLKKRGVGTSEARALIEKKKSIAALKALRRPKASFSANGKAGSFFLPFCDIVQGRL